MAHLSGTAISLADLLTALTSGLTANGWTQDGPVLYKGTCQVELTTSAGFLRIRGGTGRVAGAITGAGPFYAAIGTPAAGTTANTIKLTFPVTYELYVFSAPDEVYFVVNTDITDYQYLAFGQSDVPGLPGNGTWYQGFMNPSIATGLANPIYTFPGYTATGNWGSSGAWPMFMEESQFSPAGYNGSIHHNIDGVGWSPGSTVANAAWDPDGAPGWLRIQDPLLERQPSTVNEGAVLLPMDVYAGRPTNNVTLCLRPRNIRALRIDNYNPGEVITYGSDSWKVYPWFRKDTAARNGSVAGATHSGTMGWAIRYEGP